MTRILLRLGELHFGQRFGPANFVGKSRILGPESAFGNPTLTTISVW